MLKLYLLYISQCDCISKCGNIIKSKLGQSHIRHSSHKYDIIYHAVTQNESITSYSTV